MESLAGTVWSIIEVMMGGCKVLQVDFLQDCVGYCGGLWFATMSTGHNYKFRNAGASRKETKVIF